MRKFSVKVNGEIFNVEVEEIVGDKVISEKFNNISDEKEAIQNNRVEVRKEKKVINNANKKDITAPMPGKILEIKVHAGDEVSQGDILLILEAMKLENNITSPGDARVKEIVVQVGENVEAGNLLLKLE
jgi:glutaconyl-CoA/methylmalonyl-CoA decarboxylase subunit gamma